MPHMHHSEYSNDKMIKNNCPKYYLEMQQQSLKNAYFPFGVCKVGIVKQCHMISILAVRIDKEK